MSSPLSAAGATSEPSEYASLSMDRHMTGLWTQRSPLRDADVPWVQSKFYSAGRFDSLIDGINREVTSRLTDCRRYGCSRLNPNNFPAINSFYSHKYIQNSQQVLRLIADGKDGVVYDATGGTKTALFTSSAGAGKTRFLGVNTELFFANGVDRKKLVRSALVWQTAHTFNDGEFLVDTNFNLQRAIGAQTATIVDVQIASNVCTLFLSPTTPLTVFTNVSLTLAGMTLIPALNGTTQAITSIANSIQVSFPYVHGDVAFAVETGTATTGTGVTAGVQPAWATTIGAVTIDGGAQWICRGSSVQDWMFAAAPSAPTVTQVAAPTIYPNWAANTWYAPLFVIVDSNSKLQKLTTAGTTGGGAPAWNVVTGGTTADGSAVWTNLGSGAWASAHAYLAGDTVLATFTYWITVPSFSQVWNGHQYETVVTYVQQSVTATNLFLCTVAGTSGGTTPFWTNGIGTAVTDNTVVWTNQGTSPAWPGASQLLQSFSKVIDSNGKVQTVQTLGKSGATAPAWSTTLGGYTTDNTTNWLNSGSYGAANTGVWTYAFSGKNSITGDVSTASAVSAQILVSAGQQPVVQGAGFADTQVDEIVIWRTSQGGGVLVYLDTIPNPGNTNWIYTDTTTDGGLNPFIAAPIDSSNNPPPTGFTGPAYHLQRIWGFVGNLVYYSAGPDTLVGSGNSSFPPLNFQPYPEQVVRLVPVTLPNGGVLVFTTSNVYVILGTGTASNPFYTTIYMGGVGLGGYDGLDIVGSTVYMMTGTGKFVSLDPGAGYVESGFPIGDQFLNVTTGAGAATTGALYNPTSTYVTWHEESSGDTAIYVSDGAVGWFRLSPVASPESGFVWSPRAAIVGGTSAVQSIETSAGHKQLIIGAATTAPLRYRDSTVRTDWNGGATNTFASWDVRGNIVLCDTGEVAEIAHIGLKSKKIGLRPSVSLLLGEISATVNAPFERLEWTSVDPPDLPPSQTMHSDRYTALQNGVCPKCDNFQLLIDYGVQDAADELLKFAIYGAKHAERRQQ